MKSIYRQQRLEVIVLLIKLKVNLEVKVLNGL
jgi:hypothetical protein